MYERQFKIKDVCITCDFRKNPATFTNKKKETKCKTHSNKPEKNYLNLTHHHTLFCAINQKFERSSHVITI